MKIWITLSNEDILSRDGTEKITVESLENFARELIEGRYPEATVVIDSSNQRLETWEVVCERNGEPAPRLEEEIEEDLRDADLQALWEANNE